MAVTADDRPFAPGEYGVVVVGSGPGALQMSYCLGRLGVQHAVVSADDAPGGMFMRFPLFESLISWTHQSADVPRDTREYEAHDQNSLVADERELRGLTAAAIEEGGRRPSRAEMEAGLRAFAARAGIAVRYGCRWEATSRGENGFVLTTTDGEYRCRAAVFATGMTQPWIPRIPGLEIEQHYVHADERPERYADSRVVIIGKRNSAFEVGEAILRYDIRQLTLVSPRPAEVGRLARSPLRPWYLTPYDEHVRGAPGRFVLDAAVERVERRDGSYVVHTMEGSGERIDLQADVVVAATGFRAPLGDLPELGAATVLEGRLPALTPFWESVTLPGIFFAGNITQAAPGLRKHGVASLSGMVCGFRYNARVLARHIAERLFALEQPRPRVEQAGAAAYLIAELDSAPELAMQKGYLARVLSADGSDFRDEGILPLEAFVDGDADGLAASLEFDADEAIRPVLYARRRGDLRELVLPPHPLRRYDTPAYREPVAELVERTAA